MGNKNNNKHLKRRIISLLIIVICAIYIGFSEYQQSKIDANLNQQEYVNQNSGILEASLALENLTIKERDPKTGYKREQFSDGWQNINGCDMRNYILQRDFYDEVVSNTNGCDVLSGTLQKDPYTGETISFLRGADTSGAVQIDHIVPLSDAWQKGAQHLSPEQRLQLANDPLNLLAVEGKANIEKSDKDAANWLPTQEYRCRYVARQIAVKQKYQLWITKAEYNAIKRVLYTCPGQLLPVENSAVSK